MLDTCIPGHMYTYVHKRIHAALIQTSTHQLTRRRPRAHDHAGTITAPTVDSYLGLPVLLCILSQTITSNLRQKWLAPIICTFMFLNWIPLISMPCARRIFVVTPGEGCFKPKFWDRKKASGKRASTHRQLVTLRTCFKAFWENSFHKFDNDRKPMGPVRIRHNSHHFATQFSHFVDKAEWQAKIAFNEFGYLLFLIWASSFTMCVWHGTEVILIAWVENTSGVQLLVKLFSLCFLSLWFWPVKSSSAPVVEQRCGKMKKTKKTILTCTTPFARLVTGYHCGAEPVVFVKNSWKDIGEVYWLPTRAPCTSTAVTLTTFPNLIPRYSLELVLCEHHP